MHLHSLSADCPAVQAVADYLKAGGERTPNPPPGDFPVVPQNCPICGEEVYYIPGLGSESHYWQYHVNVLKGLFAANPWLFPPVVAPDGRVPVPRRLRRWELLPRRSCDTRPNGDLPGENV
jgi:hypothetical protein